MCAGNGRHIVLCYREECRGFHVGHEPATFLVFAPLPATLRRDGIDHLPTIYNSLGCISMLGMSRQVQYEEAHQYAEDNGLVHMETSAKNAQNVKSIFVEIGELNLASSPLSCNIVDVISSYQAVVGPFAFHTQRGRHRLIVLAPYVLGPCWHTTSHVAHPS